MLCKFALSMAAAMTMSQQLTMSEYLAQLPGYDPVTKRVAAPRWGYAETDFTHDPIAQAFLQWLPEYEKSYGKSTARAPHVLMEVGGAFGFLAKQAADQGFNYILTDRERRHVNQAKKMLTTLGGIERVEARQLTFPLNRRGYESLKKSGTYVFSSQDKKAPYYHIRNRVVGVACLKVVHFLPGRKIDRLLQDIYNFLEPGGRAFISYGTPHIAPLREFSTNVYPTRLQAFWNDPRRTYFPGEISGLENPLPRGIYPDFYHGLTNEVFRWLVLSNPQRPFEIVQEFAWRRKDVPDLYNGCEGSSCLEIPEMMGMILEKKAP